MPFTALNGHLPDSVLTALPWPEAKTFRLRADAAASLGRLAVAFKRVFGHPLLLTDAYRIFSAQEALKASKGVWAAQPGTSVHGLGLAVDLASNINSDWTPEHFWMVANAARFGWVNPAWAINQNPADGQHEPWHWEYHPELDTLPGIPASPAITTASTDWTDMATEAQIEALFRKVLAEDRVVERADMLEQAGKANNAVIAAIAGVPGVTVDHLLATAPEGGSTVWQTIRDTRTIARRTEDAVLKLPKP